VVDAEREVAEVAGAAVVLGGTVLARPVEGQLDLGVRRFRRGEEDQRVAAAGILLAAHFAQAQAVAIEAQRRVEVAHADHGVEVAHRLQSRNRSGSSGAPGRTAYASKSCTPASRSTSSSTRKLPEK